MGISQPTFSRLISQFENEVLRAGKGRTTRYALRRLLFDRTREIPVNVLDEAGTLSQAAILYGVQTKGFYLASNTAAITSKFHDHLPYIFEDLRPSGFLGRLIPRLHPDLELPEDIQTWTDEHCLKYLAQYGWDLSGNFILGDKACENYLECLVKRFEGVQDLDRENIYPDIANLVMSAGIPGSSAAGEQPKFLAIRATEKKLIPVLVKFSPPIGDDISRRVADLLVCEHITHEVLRSHGQISAESSLLTADGRLFLEIKRFDRTMTNGRKGLVSLRALDLEFVGRLRSWSDTAEALSRQKRIDPSVCRNIIWLETFGRLIGNTDRHHGNVSFFIAGEQLMGLAPVYDMLPMLYAPQQNQLVERSFDPTPPKVSELPVWAKALAAALDFWRRVQSHPQISESFKNLTAGNEQRLSRFSELGALLPSKSM